MTENDKPVSAEYEQAVPHEPGTLPQSASSAPAVPLAGVPETPLSEAGMASTGPAVPSTDHYVTEGSPNKDTSAPASEPPAVTREVSGE